eukprot:4621013-Amphidinium_carterae.1
MRTNGEEDGKYSSERVYSFLQSTMYALLDAIFGWRAGPWWSNTVPFIDFALKDMRKRQLHTHPAKLQSTLEYCPEKDMKDSASEMPSNGPSVRRTDGG